VAVWGRAAAGPERTALRTCLPPATAQAVGAVQARDWPGVGDRPGVSAPLPGRCRRDRPPLSAGCVTADGRRLSPIAACRAGAVAVSAETAVVLLETAAGAGGSPETAAVVAVASGVVVADVAAEADVAEADVAAAGDVEEASS
jgi:hypothetical protein